MRRTPFCIGLLVSILTLAASAFGAPYASLTAGDPFEPNDPYFRYDPSTPLYPGQWHLVNQAPSSIRYPASTAPNGLHTDEVTIVNAGLDMNVLPAWRRGYTGQGIIIGILDDGIELAHPDLSVVRELSVGMNDAGIVPGQDGSHGKDADGHGTSVAGMAAATGGNGIGMTGSAPQARVASIRVNNFTLPNDYFIHAPPMLWQCGLGWQNGMDAAAIMNLTTILSAPVIPLKNSSSKNAMFEYPPRFEETYAALARTAANGVLFMQAGANCRNTRQQDVNTNLEEGTPYLISVAAVGSDGKFALYSSFGSALMTAALSESANWAIAGIPGDRRYANGLGVATVDRVGPLGTNYEGNTSSVFLPDMADLDYTSQFDGTSAATPLLSGIVALAKQANPNLNVRMAKQLLARTSRVVDRNDRSAASSWTAGELQQSGWLTNRARFHFNPNYGFGLADADALVEQSIRTAYVTAETIHAAGLDPVRAAIPPADPHGVARTLTVRVPASKKQKLEGVEVYVKISGGDRSEWQVILAKDGTSSRLWVASNEIPNPPESILMGDPDPAGGIDHGFLSNAFWGEDPDGEWTLYVSNPTGTHAATFEQWGIVLHMGEIEFDKTRRLAKTAKTAGVSKNRKSSRVIIPPGKTLTAAGDVLLNGGRMQVQGTIAPQRTVLVSKLDTSLHANTEELTYARGIQVRISGGTLSGTGTVAAPRGSDDAGGVFLLGGTVRPGSNRAGGVLRLGRKGAFRTAYSQTGGALAIDVIDPNRCGRLQVSGPASLGGTLSVVTRPGAGIRRGQRLHNVVRAERITGRFTKVRGRIPGTALQWRPVYSKTHVDLVAAEKVREISDPRA